MKEVLDMVDNLPGRLLLATGEARPIVQVNKDKVPFRGQDGIPPENHHTRRSRGNLV